MRNNLRIGEGLRREHRLIGINFQVFGRIWTIRRPEVVCKRVWEYQKDSVSPPLRPLCNPLRWEGKGPEYRDIM
jgi:hypothetical protein